MQCISGSSIAPESAAAPLDMHQWRGHVNDVFDIIEHPESFIVARANYNPATKSTSYALGSSSTLSTLSSKDVLSSSFPSTIALEMSASSTNNSAHIPLSATAMSLPVNRRAPGLVDSRMKAELETSTATIHTRALNTPFLAKTSIGDGILDADVAARLGFGLTSRVFAAASIEQHDETKVWGAELRHTGAKHNISGKYSSDGRLVVGTALKSFSVGGHIPLPATNTKILLPASIDVGAEYAMKLDDMEDMFSVGAAAAWPHPSPALEPFAVSCVVNGVGSASLAFSGPVARAVIGDSDLTDAYNTACGLCPTSTSSSFSSSSSTSSSSTSSSSTSSTSLTPLTTALTTLLAPPSSGASVAVLRGSLASTLQHNLGSRESQLCLGAKLTATVMRAEEVAVEVRREMLLSVGEGVVRVPVSGVGGVGGVDGVGGVGSVGGVVTGTGNESTTLSTSTSASTPLTTPTATVMAATLPTHTTPTEATPMTVTPTEVTPVHSVVAVDVSSAAPSATVISNTSTTADVAASTTTSTDTTATVASTSPSPSPFAFLRRLLKPRAPPLVPAVCSTDAASPTVSATHSVDAAADAVDTTAHAPSMVVDTPIAGVTDTVDAAITSSPTSTAISSTASTTASTTASISASAAASRRAAISPALSGDAALMPALEPASSTSTSTSATAGTSPSTSSATDMPPLEEVLPASTPYSVLAAPADTDSVLSPSPLIALAHRTRWVPSHSHALRVAASVLQVHPALAMQYSYTRGNITLSLGISQQLSGNPRLSHAFPPQPSRNAPYYTANASPSGTVPSAPADVLWLSAANAQAGPYFTDAVTERMAICAGNGAYGHGTGPSPSPVWDVANRMTVWANMWIGDAV